MNTQLKQLGVTPLKGGAICALLAVFALVWGPQIAPILTGGGSDAWDQPPTVAKPTAKPAQPSAANRSARRAPQPTASPAADARGETASAPARTYTAIEASRYDPFAAPEWAPQPKTETVAQALRPAHRNRRRASKNSSSRASR